MNNRKRILEVGFFLAVMALTFYTILKGRNIGEIINALSGISLRYLIAAMGLAVFFVCTEGAMIWYLLYSMHAQKAEKKTSSLLRCVQYSFIGFFYSGITPSASGGQPVQLYFMNKDGNKGADSTVVLMTVAAVYKFVLVVIGTGILVFRRQTIRNELGKYFWLYLLGLALNIILVLLIAGVMLVPGIMLQSAMGIDRLFVRIGVWKYSEERKEKVISFIESYGHAVDWLKKNPLRLLGITVMTFIQRSSLFILTYVVYLGFGLRGTGALQMVILQAAVYVAVDMLPLPGAQGITELMYQNVFSNVFPAGYLLPSMLVSRGINFYFLLVISLGVTVYCTVQNKSKTKEAFQ